MKMYKCVGCGINSPLKNGKGKLAKDRPCPFCSTRERVVIDLPAFPLSKKGKRAQWWMKNKGGIVARVNVGV